MDFRPIIDSVLIDPCLARLAASRKEELRVLLQTILKDVYEQGMDEGHCDGHDEAYDLGYAQGIADAGDIDE